MIYLKYLKAKISFEHDRRTETYPFAREAVYYAIAHNCYMFGAPIQIRIEDEAMIKMQKGEITLTLTPRSQSLRCSGCR